MKSVKTTLLEFEREKEKCTTQRIHLVVVAASHSHSNIGLTLSIINPAMVKTNLAHVEYAKFLGELESIAGVEAHLPQYEYELDAKDSSRAH